MLNLRMSKTIMVLITMAFVTACTISYRNCKSGVESSDMIEPVPTPESTQQFFMNSQAQKYVADYIRKNSESLEKIKRHSRLSFGMMDVVLKRYHLPLELKYLAVIESELNPTATSRVGAMGPWQLMPETAKILGLKVSCEYDERTQYHKSTKAAAVYLRDLYGQFDDWLLVLAAYNSGPGPVCRAIKRSGSRDFWKLQYFLPAESREHVKKFIATQYYFEGAGSETTLTKEENANFNLAHNLVMSGGVRQNKIDYAKAGRSDYADMGNKSLKTKYQTPSGPAQAMAE